MGEPQIVFGDKFFLAGKYLSLAYLFEDFEEYTIEIDGRQIDGLLVELLSASSLAPQTAFNQVEMVDVTSAFRLPLPSGTKVWMPTTR